MGSEAFQHALSPTNQVLERATISSWCSIIIPGPYGVRRISFVGTPGGRSNVYMTFTASSIWQSKVSRFSDTLYAHDPPCITSCMLRNMTGDGIVGRGMVASRQDDRLSDPKALADSSARPVSPVEPGTVRSA